MPGTRRNADNVLAPVTPATDVSTEAKLVELIGQALLDGVGVQ